MWARRRPPRAGRPRPSTTAAMATTRDSVATRPLETARSTLRVSSARLRARATGNAPAGASRDASRIQSSEPPDDRPSPLDVDESERVQMPREAKHVAPSGLERKRERVGELAHDLTDRTPRAAKNEGATSVERPGDAAYRVGQLSVLEERRRERGPACRSRRSSGSDPESATEGVERRSDGRSADENDDDRIREAEGNEARGNDPDRDRRCDRECGQGSEGRQLVADPLGAPRDERARDERRGRAHDHDAGDNADGAPGCSRRRRSRRRRRPRRGVPTPRAR